MGSSADTVKLHDTPAKATKVLHADETGSLCKQSWNYRAIIGCLNYLQAMTQLDLSYSVHQCDHFCNAPKLSHKQTINCICHDLQGTRNKGLFFLPDLHAGFTCHVDADWAGNWLKTQLNDKTGALSHTRYFIQYTNCTIAWGSKLQSLVALSTTEAEIIAFPLL